MQPLWIFLHIPKTGGTTFHGHCYHHLKWDEEFVHFGPWGDNYRKLKNRKKFEDREMQDRQKAIVLSGHKTYYGLHEFVPERDARYVTFLRDPAARCVSFYNFQASNKNEMSFEEWYSEWYSVKHANQMMKFLHACCSPEDKTLPPLKAVKSLLDKCFHVGLTETIDEDLAMLFTRIGIPTTWSNYRVNGYDKESLEGLNHPGQARKITKFVKLNDEITRRVYEDNPLDVELYEYAKEIRSKRLMGVSP